MPYVFLMILSLGRSWPRPRPTPRGSGGGGHQIFVMGDEKN